MPHAPCPSAGCDDGMAPGNEAQAAAGPAVPGTQAARLMTICRCVRCELKARSSCADDCELAPVLMLALQAVLARRPPSGVQLTPEQLAQHTSHKY